MPTNRALEFPNTDFAVQAGIVVDASPTLGYRHAIRCLRLAKALEPEIPVVLLPLSEDCETFLRDASPRSVIRDSRSVMDSFPPLMITDLREPHGITAKIRQQGSRHISIHDLGLAQCRSDVAIDGSIARLFPYPADPNRLLYLGPQYMITRPPVQRGELNDTVLLTFGGGSSTDFAQRVTEQLYGLGLTVIATRGFVGPAHLRDERLAKAMSTCRFAVSGSGVSLYELAASGIPTIAVAFDRLELRTADVFHDLGAALSAGLMEDVTPTRLLCHATELINNRSLVLHMARAGQMLVDGKGLSRVVDIVRRQIWLASQTKTYMTC